MIFVVLGMHRTGTSMMAEILHNSEINMGNNLLGRDAHNLHGHFEDREFLEFDRMLLRRRGRRWYNSDPIDDFSFSGNEINRAKSMVSKRVGVWGVKEPRMVLLWKLWRRILPNDRVVIITNRSYKAVENSLIKRNGKDLFKPPHTIERLYNLYRDILSNVRQEEKHVIDVSFIDFFENKDLIIDKFKPYIELNMNTIDRRLNHNGA